MPQEIFHPSQSQYTVWAGPTAPLEQHVVPKEQIGGEALSEYFNRLMAGESEDALTKEYQARFGFAGDMADMVGLMFLDPTLQTYFGPTSDTLKFRVFDRQLPQGQISLGTCATAQTISQITTNLHNRIMRNPLTQVRVQISVIDPNPTRASNAAAAVAAFLDTANFWQNGAFQSPSVSSPNGTNIMLNQMGALVEGAGTPTLTITGVPRLHPTEHRVIGDRIVAATWGIAAVMTRGDISVTGVDPAHLQLVLHKLHDVGATVTQSDDGFRVVQYDRPKACNVATLPFPGFPTDLQPMAIALAAIADGTSMITENVFEARFRFVEEMIRLGADARTDGHHAVVRGIPQLSSAPVWSSDIRAGAGLVLAGLVADGETEVHDVFHIDRGYPMFVEDLLSLGAEIERVH
jgi:hypothetical protein